MKRFSLTGLLPSMVGFSKTVQLINFPVCILSFHIAMKTIIPYNPHPNSIYWNIEISSRFGLFPFRSPLLGEYYHNIIHEPDYPDPWIIEWFFFSFPPGTEMFYFPGFTSSSLTDEDMATLLAMGCPIRTSPDQRSLDTSPTLIAVTPRPSSPFCAKASTIRP